MVNRARQKGTAAETAVVEFLRQNGFPYAERRALNGARDRGDVAGIVGVVLEVKNCKTFDIGGWMNELVDEMENDGARIGALWIKRRGTTDPGHWYCLMDGYSLVQLLQEWAA